MDGKRPTNIVQANAEVTKMYPYPIFQHQSSASLFFLLLILSLFKKIKFIIIEQGMFKMYLGRRGAYNERKVR
jgi:hypothetical protein